MQIFRILVQTTHKMIFFHLNTMHTRRKRETNGALFYRQHMLSIKVYQQHKNKYSLNGYFSKVNSYNNYGNHYRWSCYTHRHFTNSISYFLNYFIYTKLPVKHTKLVFEASRRQPWRTVRSFGRFFVLGGGKRYPDIFQHSQPDRQLIPDTL